MSEVPTGPAESHLDDGTPGDTPDGRAALRRPAGEPGGVAVRAGFSNPAPWASIGPHSTVTDFTSTPRGWPLSTSAFNTQPDLSWNNGSPAWDRSYLPAAMRAAIIAVVLLGVLALIVLF